MSRQNTIVLNVAAGETTPEIYGRIDLPAYQRSYQRVQNYEVLPQGALRYRNGTQHTHNTKSLGKGRLIPFTFNQVDTYMLEFTNKYLQFYRALEAVLNSTTFNIASITNASPGVITTAAPHGYSTGQEVYLSGIHGMIELNDQFFLAVVTGATTLTLTDLFGNAIDTTDFHVAIAATGTVATAYGIATPYLVADLNQVHISQSGDTIILTHQDYMPYKLTRTALTAWSINFFTRTSDPFKQAQITAATQANPGVFTLANHGYKVGDTVYFDGWASGGGFWEALNQQPRTFTVNTVTTNTFTLKNNGVVLDTSGFGAPGTFGTVINTNNAPQTSAFLGMARLAYANTRNNPSGLVASELPDPTTGTTKFDDFTPGANDNNAYYFTLAPVFNQQDAIQWIATNNQVIVLGCSGSVRQLTGSSGPTSPVTPSSIQANAISNIGAAAIQPYANGLTVYYVDQTTFRVSSFVFSIQVDNYVTVNQNLIANQLSTSPFILLAQQRRESGLLWILRQDGVMAGMTFNEIESVYGWHRHYIGGKSDLTGVPITRATVLSIAVEPRIHQDSVLWLLVERQFANGHTYRSVEYWNDHIKFFDPYDYFSGESNYQAMQLDVQAFKNATSEQLKDSIHLDCNLTYDGAQRGRDAGASLSYAKPTPPPGVCYSIAAGVLSQVCNADEHVAFVLGDTDSGNPTGVYAWNNKGDSTVVVANPAGIDGEAGLAVDALNNVLYTEGFGYNAVPPLIAPNDNDLIISTAAPVGASILAGPLAPPATVAFTPHICPADTQYEWQSLILSADRSTLYALAGDLGVPTTEMLKIDVVTATVTTASADLGFGDTPSVFLSADETKLVLVGFPNAINSHSARVVVLDAADLSILSASEFVVDLGAFIGWGIDGAALSPDGSQLVFVTGPADGTIPGALYANVFDTTAFTHSQFLVGTDNGFSGVATFPKDDNANVLIYLNGSLLTFDLTGMAGPVYALGITDDGGANQIVTEPNSGLIYGTSYGTTDAILWCYDLVAQALLTEVHGLPLSGSMANICFAV